LYLVWLSRTEPPYSVAVASYVPGAVALTIALIRGLFDRPIRVPAATALVGLVLTFVAAIAQMRTIAVHPRLFDHNATYHAIQAVAILVLHRAAREFAAEPPGTIAS
jgi:hypothetical protein